jgi:hypothetical protein
MKKYLMLLALVAMCGMGLTSCIGESRRGTPPAPAQPVQPD